MVLERTPRVGGVWSANSCKDLGTPVLVPLRTRNPPIIPRMLGGLTGGSRMTWPTHEIVSFTLCHKSVSQLHYACPSMSPALSITFDADAGIARCGRRRLSFAPLRSLSLARRSRGWLRRSLSLLLVLVRPKPGLEQVLLQGLRDCRVHRGCGGALWRGPAHPVSHQSSRLLVRRRHAQMGAAARHRRPNYPILGRKYARRRRTDHLLWTGEGSIFR